MHKLKVYATVSGHRVCVCIHHFSECNHANAVQAVCHINVVLRAESECVSLEFVYVCVLVFACVHRLA